MFLAKAPTLTILIPVADAKGVLRFPSLGGPYPGLFRMIDASQTLAQQACQQAAEFFGREAALFTPLSPIDPVLKQEGQVSSVLYILRPEAKDLEADESWPTIAEILRSLPQGHSRLAYMKALQYLAGAAHAEVSVLEVDDEVRARLREQDETLNP